MLSYPGPLSCTPGCPHPASGPASRVTSPGPALPSPGRDPQRRPVWSASPPQLPSCSHRHPHSTGGTPSGTPSPTCREASVQHGHGVLAGPMLSGERKPVARAQPGPLPGGGSHGMLSPRPDEGGWRATLQRHRPHAPARAGTLGGPGVHCSLRVTGRPCTRHPRGRPFPAACRGRDRTGRWGAWRAHPSVHSLPPASVRHVRRPSRSCPFPQRPRLWWDPLPHRAWGPSPLGSETGSSISTAASPVCSSLSSEAPAVPASQPAPALRLPLVALGALTACASVHHPAACRRPLIANTVSLATSSVPWGGAGGPAQPLCLPRP